MTNFNFPFAESNLIREETGGRSVLYINYNDSCADLNLDPETVGTDDNRPNCSPKLRISLNLQRRNGGVVGRAKRKGSDA